MRRIGLLLLLLITTVFVHAQNPIGLPQINNFTNVDYKGGNQNWDIQQDKLGIMYLAKAGRFTR